MKIKVCEPSTSAVEKKWVNKALDENRISSTGGYVEKFEKEFAKKIGTKYAVAVNSGYSAIFLTLVALGIGPGDEVIIPTFTMIATANAVRHCGAKPVLIDAEWETGNIDVTKIEEKITPRTKAIMPVHIYGHPCDMDVINEIAKRHNLIVVEDSAEAHGAKYKGRFAGNLSRAGCFSFYANKIITTGEGGAITTNDKSLADEVRSLREYYFSPIKHFDHKKAAWNFRMSSLEAAYGLGQLERWDELIGLRRGNAFGYSLKLAGMSDILETPPQDISTTNVYWMYWIKVGPERDALMIFLEENGIETRTGFFPIHWQKPYEHDNGEYPCANKLGAQSLYLPSSPNLTNEEQDYVVKKIKEFYSRS